MYFYPKADTPGCTKQACGLNEVLGDVGDTVVLGISPDKPSKQAKFAEKYGLGFQLLSDPDHAVAEAYDVWKEKSMYGRKYMGIERSAFLVDEQGDIADGLVQGQSRRHAEEPARRPGGMSDARRNPPTSSRTARRSCSSTRSRGSTRVLRRQVRGRYVATSGSSPATFPGGRRCPEC